ncbi:penicillin-binding protein 2 [Parafannyhessea umbonata]|uniref:Penicillin-binding protein 2 n=1 Tax=Parafannyhessea umbonata TaxID=604330 RepID=A0A1H6JBM2_9ACTN|nr:penicillin-binding protein 2 [Parafannyhessea umbonata]SEH58145.1 penicillin-binding protein 2 [Parafannyhessea umbonata]
MSPIIVIIIVLAVILVALIAVFLLFGRGGSRFTFDIGGAAPTAAGGSDMSTETGFKTRLFGLDVFAGSIIAVLLGKLWTMQLVSSDEYSAQAESNRTRTISVDAPRGRILDRNGVELVNNRASLTVAAKSDVVQDEVEMQLLGNLIGMPKMAVKRKIEDSSGGAQSLRTVAVDVSRRVVAYIGEHPYVFEGVSVEQKTQRHYPQGNLAAHVLGYVGTVSSEQLDASKKSDSEAAISYSSGDIVGQAGVEYQYESVLQGVKGEQTVYVDASGAVLSYSGSVEARSGSDIVLTLDSKIQSAAEESLQSWIKERHESGAPDCYGGAAIAMDVTNGEVLAMASAPTFSPSVFVGGVSSDDWNQLSSESAHNPLLNRAVSGQYPSASTIKPLSTFAALDYGIANTGSTYNCTGYWTGFGSGFGQYCWQRSGHGLMTLQTGITFSCDVVFYEIGKGFFYSDTPNGLQDTFRKWGLGSKSGIDLPAEASGRVPDADWKWNYFTSSDDTARSWQGGDNTNLVIGQGDILVTPLQMLCAYAGIATGGTIWRPHVLKGVKAAVGDGSSVDYKTEVARTADEDSSYMDLVHRGLVGVVYEESESQAVHFTNMSVKVAGKTGSAQTSTEQPTGWFIAYAPADDPKYVVGCVMESSGFGSEGALYVVRDILGALYDQPDTAAATGGSAD